jgi:hypothetical protein
MKRNAISIIEEDLKICVGCGATKSVGSDSYPLYVSEILPKNVIGMYTPKSQFDDAHPWHGGTQVVDAFDPNAKSMFYIKRRYGHWWEVESNGNPIRRFTGRYLRLSFNGAYSYRDPSF